MIYERFPNWDINVEEGTVYSLRLKRFIGSKINKYGYVNVNIYPLHRVIWECVNGEIPDGYDVHHIDHNPLNNSIYNLELIESTKHRSEHKIGKKYSAKHKENISKALKGKSLFIPSLLKTNSSHIPFFITSLVSESKLTDNAGI